MVFYNTTCRPIKNRIHFRFECRSGGKNYPLVHGLNQPFYYELTTGVRVASTYDVGEGDAHVKLFF